MYLVFYAIHRKYIRQHNYIDSNYKLYMKVYMFTYNYI
jgi:hypothetical protein